MINPKQKNYGLGDDGVHRFAGYPVPEHLFDEYLFVTIWVRSVAGHQPQPEELEEAVFELGDKVTEHYDQLRKMN